MKPTASEEDVKAVVKLIKTVGLKADVSSGRYQTVIGIIGDEKKINFDQIKSLKGVYDANRIQAPYRLISRSYISSDVVVKVRDIQIGEGEEPVVIAGPCSIESYEQLHRIAKQVKEAGAHILRGGAYKPRTSIHSFQGLGLEGLKHLHNVGNDLDIPTVSEIRSEFDVEMVAKYCDMLQIGARNMYNQDLIEVAAKQGKPILFKRGFSAQIDEYLSFAERIVANGNRKLILCERGIMPLGGSFKSQTRFTLDLNSIPVLRKETPFPVIADPSHGTGRRDLVIPMSRSSIAAGAHGLMVEVHDKPHEALSDANQAILPRDLKKIISVTKNIREAIVGSEAPFSGDIANGSNHSS